MDTRQIGGRCAARASKYLARPRVVYATTLNNEHPAWLDNAHKALDLAVAKAYGWTDYTPEMPAEEILGRLLKLNLERAPAESTSKDQRKKG